MLVASVIASAVALRRGVALQWALIPTACGGVLLVVGVARPALVAPLERGWSALGHLIGRVTTPALLVLVFVVIVVPLGLLLRVLGKDVLRLRRDATAGTYWIERERKAFDFERLS
jgi:hypothetical protein